MTTTTWTKPFHGVTHLEGVHFHDGQATVVQHAADFWTAFVRVGLDRFSIEAIFNCESDAKRWARSRIRRMLGR